jgi:hypothetical protein
MARLEKLRDARPKMPEQLDDRAQDGCEILVAIADALGYGREARAALVELFASERLDDEESVRLSLLRDVRVVFEKRKMPIAIHTENLLSGLRALEESRWQTYYGRGFEDRDLAKLLRPYGVRPTTVREPVRRRGHRNNSKPAKGYKRDELYEAWERYL